MLQLTKQCEIQGAPVPTPWTDRGPICHTEVDLQCMLACQISSGSVYYVALEWRNTPNFTTFSTSTKFNMGAQLQTFPYPTISKALLSSNAFWAKSFSQTLSFISVTDRQTKNSTFLVPSDSCKVQAPPNLDMVIEDLEHVLAPLKRLGSNAYTVVMPLQGSETLGVTKYPQNKTPVALEQLNTTACTSHSADGNKYINVEHFKWQQQF